MSFTRTVPKNFEELQTYMNKIADNHAHVRGVDVNLNNNHLEIRLDGMAHMGGYSDVYLPLKKDKVNDAKTLVARMITGMSSGGHPSPADARELYDMIDPLGQ